MKTVLFYGHATPRAHDNRRRDVKKELQERFGKKQAKKKKQVELSPDLVRWLNSFSQSAAIDMCEGGDDAECVAEACLTCVDIQDRELAKEVHAKCAEHGYRPVLQEAMKHVRTL